MTNPFLDIYDIPLWSAPFGQVLLENIDYTPQTKYVLDIGSGTGFPLLELSQRFSPKTYLYGIDIDKTSIDCLRKKIIDTRTTNVTALQENAENLSFDDNYFDLIVSNNGINNIANKEKVFSECYRTCNFKGQLVFTYNLNDTYSSFYNIFLGILKKNNLLKEVDRTYNHIEEKRPQIDQIKFWVRNSGFTITDISYSQFKMCFSNATSFFNHYFIKKYFLPEWKKIVNDECNEIIFEELKKELEKNMKGFLEFKVPFACIVSRKQHYGSK